MCSNQESCTGSAQQHGIEKMTLRETKQTQTATVPPHPNVEIAVENFGPIAEAAITLRPLILFVGRSNTGKTYFSTLIYALHGILEGFPRCPLLNRANALFSEVLLETDFSGDSSVPTDDIQEFPKKLEIGNQPLKFSELPQRIRDEVRAGLRNSEGFENELRRCFDRSSVSKLLRASAAPRDEMAVSVAVREANQELWRVALRNSGSNTTVSEQISENLCIRPEEIERSKFSYRPIKVRQCYYLPASRSGAIQSHAIIASSLVARATRAFTADKAKGATLTGILADFLQHLILYKESGVSNSELLAIADTLEVDLLDGKIVASSSPSGYPEFLYCPHRTEDMLRLSHASAIVSELAPLVLFLRGGICPGDTLIIEEPEAHLHPDMQVKMAVLLARLVRAGVQVVATTHSDWLLQEIANLIREGELVFSQQLLDSY